MVGQNDVSVCVSIPLRRRRVTSFRRRAQAKCIANVPAASYCLRRVVDDVGRRQGVPGAQSAVHHCFVRFANFLCGTSSLL